ncbi:MAG TPA: hypothetical protein VME66_01240 [Candidatus Acidoferrales bacterium]|nr:hypothetical protein [Candidatus Acidoferrales bacterium]
MSRIGSLAVRVIVVFGLTALIGVTACGMILSHATHYRIVIGIAAFATDGIVSIAFWSAMRDVDRDPR